jgi:hypothetical protein
MIFDRLLVFSPVLPTIRTIDRNFFQVQLIFVDT